MTGPDRLALATLPRTATRGGPCGLCESPIVRDDEIVRLTSPAGWAHLNCPAATRTTARNHQAETLKKETE